MQVNVSNVKWLAVNQLVTVIVIVKVMDLSALEKVMSKEGKELLKQECGVCDDSGCAFSVVGTRCSCSE